MGSTAAKPMPTGRRNRVEQEILRCAVTGEDADFTQGNWGRVRKVNSRPVVRAQFIADLWLGLLDTNVHPTGIFLRGLHIDGCLSISGGRIDARLRTPLVGFFAQDCSFPDGLNIAYARCESLYLVRCAIGPQVQGVPDEPETAATSAFRAIGAHSADVVGRVVVLNCEISGAIDFVNSVIDDDFIMQSTVMSGSLEVAGSEIRGGLSVTDCIVRGPATHSINAAGVEIGAATILHHNWFSGGIQISYARSQVFGLFGCRIGSAGLTIREARIEGALSIRHTRIHGPLALCYSDLSSNAQILDTVTSGSVDLSGNRCAGDLWLYKLRSCGPIWGRSLAVEGKTSLVFCRACATHGQTEALDLNNAIVGALDIVSSDFTGLVRFDDAQCFRLDVVRITAGISRFGQSLSSTEPRHDFTTAFSIARARIATDLTLSQCAVGGTLSLKEVRIGGRLSLGQCWFGGDATAQSIDASASKIESLFIIDYCVLPGSLTLPGASMSELQFYECRIGHGRARPTITRFAIWGDNVTASRCIVFCKPEAEEGRGTLIQGTVSFVGAQIGAYLQFCGIEVQADECGLDEGATASVVLASVRVGTDLMLGRQPDIGGTSGSGEAIFHGAVVLDGLVADSVTLSPLCTIGTNAAGGAIMLAPTDARMLDDKHGVALSARNVEVAKRFRIAASRLDGTVDLREASVGTLADRGGAAWRDCQLPPGKLLLDGFTYANLDDDDAIDRVAARGSTNKPSGMVARRLRWLAMQYPDSKPDKASFFPQPYEQLAHHFAALGDERARRQVLVHKRRLQRQHTGLGWTERAISGLLGLTSNYGYSPRRASIASALLIGLGSLMAWVLYSFGAIDALDRGSIDRGFSPLLYALDVAVPFLDLGHDAAWAINPRALTSSGLTSTIIGLGEALYRLAGLVMLSITVLTFSGILHEKE